jgi:cell division protease FtsH
VTKWGLSPKMGPLMYDESEEEVFLGRSASQGSKTISGETAKHIDEEVRRIIDECYATARQLLEENMDKLHIMAEALMLYETIDAGQIDDIMSGRTPREPADWGGGAGGSGSRSSKPADAEPKSARDSGSPIGGPAAEH